MDLRKKIKNFFTLTRKANAGFTLVELIVVIAILAILGGVAVPAYSGYVKKAERSADEALLNELNTAFASACMANGESNINREDNPKINITDKTIDAVNPLLNTSADIQESFKKFFEGEGEAFKAISDVYYDKTLGIFADETVVIETIKQYLAASSFNGHIEEVTGDVGTLVGLLGGFLKDGEGENIIVGTAFETYLSEALGINAATEENEQKLANAAVLYLADSAAKMTDENVRNAKATLAVALSQYARNPEEYPLNGDIISDMAADTGSGLAGYAMLYATAEAIALKEGEGTPAYEALKGANPNNPTAVINAAASVFKNVDSAKLLEYIGTDEGSAFDKDMDAYLQTMKAVNSKEGELKDVIGTEGSITESDVVKDLLAKLEG